MKYISSFKKYILISAVSILGLSSNVYAQDNLMNKDSIKEVSFQDSVPEELKPWIKWIEKQNPQLKCPQVSKQEGNNNNFCNFISQLEIDANKDNYEINVQGGSYVSGYITLPQATNIKGQMIWPKNIRLNNIEPIVQEKNGRYVVEVEKGSFNITYQIEKNNNKLDNIILDKNILIFKDPKGLFKKENNIIKNKELLPLDKQKVEDNKDIKNLLDIKVWRNLKIENEILLNTKIKIIYSGNIKEMSLGKVLPNDFHLLKAESNLKIEYKDNEFYVTMMPGEYFIDVEAYKLPIYKINEDEKINTKNLINNVTNEIWTVIQQDNYTTLNIANEVVDANINNVPMQWKNLTAYNIKDSFNYKVNTRGINQEQGIKLNSQRKSWIGFNNHINDVSIYHIENINLENKSTNFLEFNKKIEPQSIQINNKYIPIVENQNKVGLVIPQDNGQINLNFITKGLEVPLYSLQGDLNLTNWEVMLAPRMRILAVQGNVETINTWIDSWNLYKVFLVFLISMIFYKVFGKKAALLSLFGLIILNEVNNLSYLFIINILVVIFLLKVLPKENLNMLRKITLTYGVLAFIYFGVQIFNYTREEIQLIINPSLERINLNTNDNNQLLINNRQMKKMIEGRVPEVFSAPSVSMEKMEDSSISSVSKNVMPQMAGGIVVENMVNKESVDESILGKKIQIGKPSPNWTVHPGSNTYYKIKIIGSINENTTVRLILADVLMVNVMGIMQIIILLLSLFLYGTGLLYFYKKESVKEYLPLKIQKLINIER